MTTLTGAYLHKTSVFDLKKGATVYDKESNRTGVISDIRETRAECIEAFIKLEGDDKEYPAHKFIQLVLL